ncbi:hypothetical protein L1280_003104 [Deinococcus sp. HSC-46F16]|uniref:hypothetical protein n=1 Tax=Deinococcus sp. HSC-46F16 TaxID=2910968 RepID=UPI00209F3483|nr:hypothetical protein [Deinococcus sp. HSC-46F16]MCP2015921.1 hypothetical protein [Deinococcus sp. HSC-46F16]
MTAPDDLAYYDLERYLFETVSRKFAEGEEVTTFDFFCIVVWKSNRAKSRVAARLMNRNADLDAAVRQLVGEVREAEGNRARLKVLLQAWQLRLPMATAILTVFCPEDFTIYDYRACEQLGDFADLADRTDFDRLWEGYERFVAAVHAAVPGELSLRDKDRALWGRSFSQQLKRDIERWSALGHS